MTNIFDDRYHYFSQSYLTGSRTKNECSLIEALCGLRVGDKILDMGCGNGRISNELAARGYVVTGVDWVESSLAYAADSAVSNGVAVKYLNGGIDTYIYAGEFDCVLSWYTSFGYEDDVASQKQLKEFCRMLKVGGCLLLDHINRDKYIRRMPEFDLCQINNDFMVDFFEYQILDGMLKTRRCFYMDGDYIEKPYETRLLSCTELRGWLIAAGFSNVSALNEDGDDFSLDSNRMMLLGVK